VAGKTCAEAGDRETALMERFMAGTWFEMEQGQPVTI
jgi:hypothetical protein